MNTDDTPLLPHGGYRKLGRKAGGRDGWGSASVSGSQSSPRWNKSSGGEEHARWKQSQFAEAACQVNDDLGSDPAGHA